MIILRQNEKLVKVVREHWMFLIEVFFTWPWILVGLVFVRYLLNFNFFGFWNLVFIFAVVVIGFIVLYRYFIWRMNALIITDQRVIENLQQGFFAKSVTELLYQDILEISYSKQGLNATLYGYGDLKIRTAAKNEVVFERVPNPDQVVTLINNIRQASRHIGMPDDHV